MFYVVSSRNNKSVAVVCYGWENRDFYAKWLHDDDPSMIDELRGPVLNLSSPQSKLAPAILEMIEEVVLPDQTYVERVKHHYTMLREKIDGKRLSRKEAIKRRKRRALARSRKK